MNLVLKLSKLCNLRCSYCYEFDQLGDARRMPLDGLQAWFAQLARHFEGRATPPIQFALHGGEPLLLPRDYLRALVRAQQDTLGAAGVAFRNSIQTNLYRVPDGLIDELEALDIGLGVSLDVSGGARVSANGLDAEARVARHLDALLADGARERLRIGGITVLHAGNHERAEVTFRFFAERGLDYRILPIFALAEPPERMAALMLSPEAIAAAFRRVIAARLSWTGAPIRIHPLDEYLETVAHHQGNRPRAVRANADADWAWIVDTNGDVYSHSDTYDAPARLGNAFTDSVDALLDSPARGRVLAGRAERARACEACEFGNSCTRLPMVEAVPSERHGQASTPEDCRSVRPLLHWLSASARRGTRLAAGA